MASNAGTSNASSNGDFFGWDLLYKTIESNINKKSDVLVALLHFVLIKNYNFQCVGVGDDKTMPENNSGSELLPDGWNDDDVKYALRYTNNDQLYIVLGYHSEDCLIINLLDVKTKKVSNIGLSPAEHVEKTKGSVRDLIPNASLLVNRIKKEVVDPVFTGNTREITTQTTTSTAEERPDPLRIGQPMRPLGQFMPVGPRPFTFPGVGRGDLDPLGRAGGGNLFPFPSRPDFPGTMQPRFDPYGPIDPNLRNANPNPDHLQPPNFGGHDFYM